LDSEFSSWPFVIPSGVTLTRSPTPTGFAEIVSDGLPFYHLELCSRHCLLFKTSPNDSGRLSQPNWLRNAPPYPLDGFVI
jgi:hypothetical protein